MILLPFIVAEPVRITVDAAKPTVEVPRSLFGVFFEEINHAGEGGVYSELLQNRSLVGDVGSSFGVSGAWKAFSELGVVNSPDDAPRPGNPQKSIFVSSPRAGSVTFASTNPLNEARRRFVRIVRKGSPIGIANGGFWGIPLMKGERHTLTMWVRSDVPFSVGLHSRSALADHIPRLWGKTFSGAGGGWRRVNTVFTSSVESRSALLTISPEGDGTLDIAYASLKPENTWKGHGLRPDLAERVAALKPGFFRFPGGCYIEGQSLAEAWDWKRTLGPPETRPGMDRTFWGYPSSDGLGFHEYLQFSEDLGAKAMYVANVGLSHSDMATLDGRGERSMDRYVQDALDAIEYANGSVKSKWGALRAKAGHPKPFGLKYIEIGNENGYSWSFGGPAAYAPRFRRMRDAIEAKYPEIVTIANNPIADGGPQNYDLLSEHYYESPAWFWRNAGRYDRYPRTGPKIYVGEYAVTQGSGRGNLAGALGEAAFMTGMERNADIVRMASYAPLLENVNSRQWNPNAIVFDSTRSYGTPSYWVQALFAQNRISRVLTSQASTPVPQAPRLAGNVGLMTWNTSAEFKDVRIEPGVSTDRPFNTVPEPTGTWSEKDGLFAQSDLGENRRYILRGTELDGRTRVTLSLKARKLSGREGFIILLGGSEGGGSLQWNLGGWGNTRHAFQLDDAIVEPAMENLTGAQKIETGRWYDIRIERDGNRVRGYLDGALLQEATITPASDLATIAGRAENGDLLVRLVNGSSVAREAQIDFTGFVPRSGTVTVLSGSPAQENSLEKPDSIAPRRGSIARVGRTTLYVMPPHSLSILRLKR